MLKFLPLGQSYHKSTFWRRVPLVVMNMAEWNCSGHGVGVGVEVECVKRMRRVRNVGFN